MLTSELRPAPSLDRATIGRMYEIFERHYEATTMARFEQDLAPKQWVLLLHDEHLAIRGFSTLQVYERQHQGERCRILFSGDTVIDRDHWGEQELAFNWLRLAGRLKGERPELRHFWFLISKGHRTYRYLPAFAQRFFPHWREPIPSFEAGLLKTLAVDHFGSHFAPEAGVVRFPESQGHLRTPLAEISARELRLESVRFFLARNPGYARGEELCCLCELEPENLKSIGRRMFLTGVEAARQETSVCLK